MAAPPNCYAHPAICNGRFMSIALKNPALCRRRRAPAVVAGEVKLSLSGSCGEYGRREWDELRQFPQVLGGGGQQELVFRSAGAAQAQSIEPEDALQMSEEHLDLLTLTP
jgi:hypothetical protein